MERKWEISAMIDFRIVPDVLREREPVRRGRTARSPLSKALLSGKTVLITGERGVGNLYKLAVNHNMRARTKKTLINGEIGTLAWFEDEGTIKVTTRD
jgi:hypothetical protein